MGFRAKLRKARSKILSLKKENERLKERIIKLNSFERFDIIDVNEEERTQKLCHS